MTDVAPSITEHSPSLNWVISPDVLQAAAESRYGPDVRASAPYWVDGERVRVGIELLGGDVSFGADFLYKQGRFA